MSENIQAGAPARQLSRWRRRLVVYSTVYLIGAMSVIFGGCADRLILFPSAIDARPLGPQRLMLEHGDGHLEIWINASRAGSRAALDGGDATTRPAPPEPEAFVLTFNGNADRADNMVMAETHFWSDHPVEIWAMNYPGYGLSTGPARLKKLAPAALATFDALRQRAGDRPIIVSGMSLGTAVALHVAANRPVHGVVLWNPPPLRQLILGRFGWWNLWLAAGPVALGVPSDLDSLAHARRSDAPAVFVLSTFDEVVPHKYQQRVSDAYAGPAETLTLSGGHNDPLTPEGEQSMRQKLRWLYETIAAGPAAPAEH